MKCCDHCYRPINKETDPHINYGDHLLCENSCLDAYMEQEKRFDYIIENRWEERSPLNYKKRDRVNPIDN